MSSSSQPRRAIRRPLVSATLAFVAIVLISVNLRPGATSVGPVLEELRSGLGMSAPVAGVMTALPGLCFAIAGALAIALARRTGLTGGITLGVVAIVVGLVLRSLVGAVWLFLVLSVVALAGMAVGNVLVPAWIKRHAGDRDGLLMTLYSAGLTLGGSIGSLFAAPMAAQVAGGWRSALGVWALFALVALAPWVVITRRELRETADHRAPSEGPAARLIRSRTAWALCLYFGVQATNAYIQFGWLPQIYRDAGLSAETAGVLTSVVAGLGVVGGLLMPGLVSRSPNLSWAMLVLGAIMAAGYLGLLVAPASHPWVWAIMLGVAGWTFPAAITMVTARTRDPHVTGQLSAFVQPAGYLFAAIGPLVVGVIHSATGNWHLVIILLALSAIPMTAAGLLIARPRYVDEEIALP
ncbi:MAG TPA: MFS transporter [Segeticoccus sp.]|uniref:CynX/NimT family MFS transporter n=1 Tax=Segeticoccus sp. TaxID=2706531 RepID=UPI002D7E33FB|nr:MFS transporter [Segeticoccus sp.]HET8600006.1 MFS transporter [Segeticoccus sp.]